MAGPLPDGDPVPLDGALPVDVARSLEGQPMSIYLHVPFCGTRCGYCDFNTYTPGELGGDLTSAYVDAAHREIELAGRHTAARVTQVPTVFVGGGTPTLLPSATLVGFLSHIRDVWGLADDVEVTTEANPESVTAESLAELREGGFTRVSFGMQSTSQHVLATLERQHTPRRIDDVVCWARQAGFEQVSVDAIYGTPGESMGDWEQTLRDIVALDVDHVSAYALIVEEGTRLAGQMRRGVIPRPSDDDQADKYLLAEQILMSAGMSAYELSNWARPGAPCRHNIAYWRSKAWWGIGPGAHSHIAGLRWWNVKHPRAYIERLSQGHSPGFAQELLNEHDRRVERVLLEVRLAEGLPVEVLTDTEQARLPDLVVRGLIDVGSHRVRLSLPGRLLADAVVRELLD